MTPHQPAYAEFFVAALATLCESDPQIKAAQVQALTVPKPEPDWPQALLSKQAALALPSPTQLPGRPERPLLVPPRQVPTRGLGTMTGRQALAHAVAHIEFNAINLALDACWRFRGLPRSYYADWLSVAQDEARHFLMMQRRLQQMGVDYGDFPAHNGLWEAAEKTAHDFTTRMACVPRVLEARGLDVTPGIIERLQQTKDAETVAVLEVILAEEVRHVAIGTHWFHFGCAAQGLEPISSFQRIVREQGMGVCPPFNLAARAAAGFAQEEFLQLTASTDPGTGQSLRV
jgi:uncharacterized ferritin-like protein (DUF455 family)